MMSFNKLLRITAALAGLVLFASACSGSSGLSTIADSATPEATGDASGATDSGAIGGDAASEEPGPENQLPQVPVIDISTGEEVVLSSFAPAETPIVLWFWAPH